MKNSILALFVLCWGLQGGCQDKDYDAIIHTDHGSMKVKLYEETPEHKKNFLKLAGEGFYDSLLFHRVIQEFMIQGGDPDSRDARSGQQLGQGGPGYTLPAEIHEAYFHKKGALSAARKPDQVNPKKESSGSQFYIVQGKAFTDKAMNKIEQQAGIKIPEEHREVYRTTGGTPHLDQNYTVFGEVVEGLEVIDKIAAERTDRNNRPNKDVKMWIEVVE